MPKYQYFTVKELSCPHCGECHMDGEFMGQLDAMRDEMGFPFIVTSAYRCPDYNAEISKTGLAGPHTTGKAVDLLVSGHQADLVHEHYRRFGFVRIGIRQHGDVEKRFLHLDTLTVVDSEKYRRRLWTYP